MWHEACVNPTAITNHFRVVPSLDDFPIRSFEFHPSPVFVTLNLCGILATFPDHMDVKVGHLPEYAELGFEFQGVTRFSFTGVPVSPSGKLTLEKQKIGAYFAYESTDFQFAGTCERIATTGVFVLTKHDPAHPPPRGPSLYGHSDVWNSCLLVIREYGYSLRVDMIDRHRGFASQYRWSASKDDRSLTASNPIELLGLVEIHRHQKPQHDDASWWRVSGPYVIGELIDECEKRRSLPDS